MMDSLHSERFYLQRDGVQDIYIDLPKPLPQHQLDGIRFLYKHFKKKTPGVILNDPSGYGKCYQVISFLKAMRPVLKKPVLILSNEVYNWKEQFEKIWGNCDDELSIEARSPSSRKLVHINPVEDGFNFIGRCWSIVVLHDVDCTKKLLKMTFYSDYKIWVTSTDLKDYLPVLTSIYEWLHPNQKFNKNFFIVNKHDKKDVVSKALLLDSLLEDFYIRRNNFRTPFLKDSHQSPAPRYIHSPPKATLKNKDPTGTKVKRCRKRIINDDNIEEQNTVKRNTVSNNKELSIESDSKNIDVQNLTYNEEPTISENFMDFVQNSNDSSECITVKIDANEKDLDFGIFDSIMRNNKVGNSDNGPNPTENNYKESQSSLVSTQNDLKSDKVVDGGNNIIVPDTADSEDSPTILLCTHTNESVIEENNVTKTNVTIIPETEQSEDTNNILPIQNNDSEDINSQNSPNLILSDEVANKTNETDSPKKFGNEKNIKDSEDAGDASDNTNCKNKIGTVKEEGDILSDIDAKLAEHEAMALKRFKGTLLDRLF
ncbi:uncharacterized protein LOC126368711 [Pectinophora gossypiella]|uniref:uncharacterized protein LOC126368711 n=1 Tax=Pectinophora gossypiella TaxID=13191 RepID=UPI00214E142D|nr:uncharacterized protein LOC126368711 [Pectinophora gossypiella]